MRRLDGFVGFQLDGCPDGHQDYSIHRHTAAMLVHLGLLIGLDIQSPVVVEVQIGQPDSRLTMVFLVELH